MPYNSNLDLPDSIQQHLPKHAQDIYREAYTSTYDEYHNEQSAHRVAWSAVKKKYEKGDDDHWHAKK